MYLCGYSLDNLSLMALTVATGFVVDDAIVVLENITRHVEDGMSPMDAALKGASEVGFTVLSMSISLIAVFIPILLMGGIIGRLFREFAMVISISIMISLAISLATTPMMCAVLLRGETGEGHGWLYRMSERFFEAMLDVYRRTLAIALRHPASMMLVLAAVLGPNFYLYSVIPKGFFPQQDTGRLTGSIQADQSISFQLMQKKLTQFITIIKSDPAVETAVGFTGGGQTNSGFVFVSLKPLGERNISADRVIARLRREMAVIPGATLFLQAVQVIRVGGRASNAQYQFTLQGPTFEELNEWTPKIAAALQGDRNLTDVNSDQQNKGLESDLVIDRDKVAQLGITVSQVDNTLYDAFGQRQVSTIYVARNQYHVIMEVAPQYWQNPETLKDVWISTSGAAVGGSQSTNAVAGTVAVGKNNRGFFGQHAGRPKPCDQFDRRHRQGGSLYRFGSQHQRRDHDSVVGCGELCPGRNPARGEPPGTLVANTISFNLPPGGSLSSAVTSIEAAMNRIGVPASIRGTFQGSAKAFQDLLQNQPFLILAALVTIYIVLGVLYESYVHPLTIFSTLPSAGVGALLALMAFNTEFSIMALIGVILLIGIVKKNAIMMIDFALEAERNRGLSSVDAIYEACLLRFRPIMMTTMAALLGALPLAIGMGDGGELRQPLGIAIVGGLILSQVLTLYSTPVIYLYMDQIPAMGPAVEGRRNTARTRDQAATRRVDVGIFDDRQSFTTAHATGKLSLCRFRLLLLGPPALVGLHPWNRTAGSQPGCAGGLSRRWPHGAGCPRSRCRLVARLQVQRVDLADGCSPALQSRYRGCHRPDRSGRCASGRAGRPAIAFGHRDRQRRANCSAPAAAWAVAALLEPV